MASARAVEENGRWLVNIDVTTYGGDELSITQAEGFAAVLRDQIEEAKRGRAQQRVQ